MKRILLSSLVLLLLAGLASQFVRLQECQATTESDIMMTVRDEPVNIDVVDVSRIPLAVAQADSLTFEIEPGAVATPKPSTKRTIRVPVTETVYKDVIVEMGAVTPLQQRYSVLMLKRAQRMTEEELEAAIAEVEAELKDQDDAANAELKKAIEILEQLQQNSDGTPAARRAGQALPILQGRPKPTPAGGATKSPRPVQSTSGQLEPPPSQPVPKT